MWLQIMSHPVAYSDSDEGRSAGRGRLDSLDQVRAADNDTFTSARSAGGQSASSYTSVSPQGVLSGAGPGRGTPAATRLLADCYALRAAYGWHIRRCLWGYICPSHIGWIAASATYVGLSAGGALGIQHEDQSIGHHPTCLTHGWELCAVPPAAAAALPGAVAAGKAAGAAAGAAAAAAWTSDTRAGTASFPGAAATSTTSGNPFGAGGPTGPAAPVTSAAPVAPAADPFAASSSVWADAAKSSGPAAAAAAPAPPAAVAAPAAAGIAAGIAAGVAGLIAKATGKDPTAAAASATGAPFEFVGCCDSCV